MVMLINRRMNYQAIYNKLILQAQERCLFPEVYRERHHIVPRCMGGTDDKSNLVELTGEEHFVAHQLLAKIHPKNHKLMWAMRLMTASRKGQIRNNKEYGWIKKRIAQYLRETRTGVKTGKQKIWHSMDPYLKATILAQHWDILACYKTNPYRSAEEVIISSRLFVSIY